MPVTPKIPLYGLCVALLLAGCAGLPAASTAAPDPPAAAGEGAVRWTVAPALADTSWELVSMPGAALLVGMRGPLSLSVDQGGRVSGYSGVNRFGASARVEGDRLRFSQALATRMAGPPEAMALEADFLGRLQRVTGWRIEADRLQLLEGSGSELMTLRRMAPGVRP
jgi:putative lipoprotein